MTPSTSQNRTSGSKVTRLLTNNELVSRLTFLSCFSIALTIWCVVFQAGVTIQLPFGLRVLETIARANTLGLPIAALFGAPILLWLCARIPSRLAIIAISPILGVMPGLAVVVAGLLTSVSSTVFWGLLMMSAGGWSAFLSTIFYFLLAKKPRVAISLGGAVIILILVGWVSIWLRSL